MGFLRGKVRGAQRTGGPSREAKICTERRSPCETMIATDANDDTTEILVVEDGDRVLEVVERRLESMRRCRIGTLGVNCGDLQLDVLQIQSRDRLVLGFRRLSIGEPTLCLPGLQNRQAVGLPRAYWSLIFRMFHGYLPVNPDKLSCRLGESEVLELAGEGILHGWRLRSDRVWRRCHRRKGQGRR